MSNHSNPIDMERLVRKINYYESIIEKLLAGKIPHSVASLEKKIIALEEMILQIPIDDNKDESRANQELVDKWRDSVVSLWERLFDVTAMASAANSSFIDGPSTSAGNGKSNRNSKAPRTTSIKSKAKSKSSDAESSAPSPVQKHKKVLAQPAAMTALSTSEAIPATLETIPSISEAIPVTSDVVPPTSEAIPTSSDAVPSTTEAIPDTLESIPSTLDTIAAASEAIPATSEAIPTTSDAVPSTSEAVPANSANGPRNKQRNNRRQVQREPNTTHTRKSQSFRNSNYGRRTSNQNEAVVADVQETTDATC